MRARLPMIFAAISAMGALGYPSSGVRAAPPVIEGDVSPIIAVVIAGASDAAARARLTSSLRRSLQRLGATVTIAEVAFMNTHDVATAGGEPPAVRVRAWIDLGKAGVAIVYVTGGENVFVRQLDIGRGLDLMALDLLDVVVTDSIATVLTGRKLGLTREEFSHSFEEEAPLPSAASVATPGPAPSSRPASTTATANDRGGSRRVTVADHQRPSSSPSANTEASATAGRDAVATSRRRSLDLDAAIAYEISLLAPPRIVQGPGLRLTARRAALRLDVGVRARFMDRVVTNDATVGFSSGGVLLSAGYAFNVGVGLTLVPSLAAGADVTRVHTVSARVDVVPVSTFFVADPIVRPTVAAERRFGRLIASVSLGLDIDVVGSRYVVDAPPLVVSVLRPSRLRPLATIAFGTAL